MNISESSLRLLMEASAARVMEMAGVSDNELTYNKARKIYGTWFVDEVRSGRLAPIRCSGERYVTRYFRLSDILTHKASMETAEIF